MVKSEIKQITIALEYVSTEMQQEKDFYYTYRNPGVKPWCQSLLHLENGFPGFWD